MILMASFLHNKEKGIKNSLIGLVLEVALAFTLTLIYV